MTVEERFAKVRRHRDHASARDFRQWTFHFALWHGVLVSYR